MGADVQFILPSVKEACSNSTHIYHSVILFDGRFIALCHYIRSFHFPVLLVHQCLVISLKLAVKTTLFCQVLPLTFKVVILSYFC